MTLNNSTEISPRFHFKSVKQLSNMCLLSKEKEKFFTKLYGSLKISEIIQRNFAYKAASGF